MNGNLTAVDLGVVDDAVARLGTAPAATLPLLQALQESYHWLPPSALARLAQHLGMPVAQVVSVASFYHQFRLRPRGRRLLRVCDGTACHLKGAPELSAELRRQLLIPPEQDTDDDEEFTVETVHCVGCCTQAPVVLVEDEVQGRVRPTAIPALLRQARQATNGTPPAWADLANPRHTKPPLDPPVAEVRVCLDSCCVARGAGRLAEAALGTLRRGGCQARLKPVACTILCERAPLLEVAASARPVQTYAELAPGQVEMLLRQHLPPTNRWRRLWQAPLDWLSLWADPLGAPAALPAPLPGGVSAQGDPAHGPFFARQRHLATEHFGVLEPLDLDDYLAHDGFVALRRCLAELTPEAVIATLAESGLRGRGGAGFPTARKWTAMRANAVTQRVVIANGDEGDPGAFMDRMLLESFPFRVIEGLLIAAWAAGASQAYLYVRAEYPHAVRRLRAAIAELERRGWLGERLLGQGPPVTVAVFEGAGAFVCGEETALLESMEGRRGVPRLRPPYPVNVGLRGLPTLINNIETLALVPWILRHGAAAFAAMGTATSKGTKVFALAGKIRRGGLIEVPMGITIRQIVEDIGGGVPAGRQFKGVLIGGPSGGCVPASLADTPVDYESLQQVGAIMGSGGLVVLDDRDCVVSVARYLMRFCEDESCGKCSYCRLGTHRLRQLLDKLVEGHGTALDLQELERLAGLVGQGSLCGLGKTAPNPLLSTLRHFRAEYEAHLAGCCPAGACHALTQYHITDACVGCTLCAQSCPTQAILAVPLARHQVLTERCVHCDQCRQVCPEAAVEVRSPCPH